MKRRSSYRLLALLALVGIAAMAAGAWMLIDSTRQVALPPDSDTGSAGAADSTPPEEQHPPHSPQDALKLARRSVGPDGIIVAAISRFRLRAGRYPGQLADLFEAPANLGPNERWDGPYLHNRRLVQDPWGKAYLYRCPGERNPAEYDLWSSGSDRISETADDIGNW